MSGVKVDPTREDLRRLIELAKAEGMTWPEIVAAVFGSGPDVAKQYASLDREVVARRQARRREEDAAGGRLILWIVGCFIVLIAVVSIALIVWHQWSSGGAG